MNGQGVILSSGPVRPFGKTDLAWMIGGVLLLGSGLSGGTGFQSYLWSWIFWAGLPLGALSLELLFRLTGGEVARSIGPALEPIRATLGPSLFLFVPVLFGIHRLYPWAGGPSGIIESQRAGVMTPVFFGVRAVIYLLTWFWISRSRKLPAAAGMILFILIGTFASIDWVMSLEPRWISTLFGLIFVLSQALAAYAWALASRLRKEKSVGPLSREPKHLRGLGNVLLAFAMTWTYLSFMQLLVVWSGDLPRESGWYLARSTHGWEWVAALLAIGIWAVPMLTLLFRRTKDVTSRLRAVSAVVAGLSAVHFYWMVVPAFGRASAMPKVSDVACFFGLGALWLVIRHRVERGLAP